MTSEFSVEKISESDTTVEGAYPIAAALESQVKMEAVGAAAEPVNTSCGDEAALEMVTRYPDMHTQIEIPKRIIEKRETGPASDERTESRAIEEQGPTTPNLDAPITLSVHRPSTEQITQEIPGSQECIPPSRSSANHSEIKTEARPENEATRRIEARTDRVRASGSRPSIQLNQNQLVLGKEAVAAVDQAASAAVSEAPDEQLAKNEREVATAIRAARQALQETCKEVEKRPHPKGVATRILNEQKMPPGIRGIVETYQPKDGWGEDATMLDKLIATDEAGNPIVHDLALLNVMQWHNERHTKAERLLSERLPDCLTTFASFVDEAVENYQLPPTASTRLEGIFAQTAVELDDGQRTIATGVSGKHLPRTDIILLWDPEKESVFWHECMHTLEAERDEAGNILSQVGSLEGILPGIEGERILAEALAAHHTYVITHPGASIFDTNTPADGTTYPAERRLLDTFCRFGRYEIDVRYFVDAWLEAEHGRQVRRQDSAHQRLYMQIRGAFPDYSKIQQATAQMARKDTHAINDLVCKIRTPRRKWGQKPLAYDRNFRFTSRVV